MSGAQQIRTQVSNSVQQDIPQDVKTRLDKMIAQGNREGSCIALGTLTLGTGPIDKACLLDNIISEKELEYISEQARHPSFRVQVLERLSELNSTDALLEKLRSALVDSIALNRQAGEPIVRQVLLLREHGTTEHLPLLAEIQQQSNVGVQNVCYWARAYIQTGRGDRQIDDNVRAEAPLSKSISHALETAHSDKELRHKLYGIRAFLSDEEKAYIAIQTKNRFPDVALEFANEIPSFKETTLEQFKGIARRLLSNEGIKFLGTYGDESDIKLLSELGIGEAVMGGNRVRALEALRKRFPGHEAPVRPEETFPGFKFSGTARALIDTTRG